MKYLVFLVWPVVTMLALPGAVVGFVWWALCAGFDAGFDIARKLADRAVLDWNSRDQ